MPIRKETNWELIVSGDELAAVARERAKEKEEATIPNNELKTYIDNGWSIKKEGKRKTKIEKNKKIGDSFEDELWTIFYKMGFKYMNSTNKFALSYSDDKSLSKQVDIVAIDDEVALLIECKETATDANKKSWDKEINEIGNLQNKLFAEIRKQFPSRKCRYIFAVKNYILGKQDKDRLVEDNISFFDYNAVLYYKSLANYLGSASKYQLLGSLFAKQEIKNMNNVIPAIKGKMGGLWYYAFLLEPETLLKIGYVLHRTNANNDYDELLPSYQRLIKKERLKAVREFINNGGYFPNSIIISIDTPKGNSKLQFDQVDKSNVGETSAKLGMLHLPKTYQSAYIIDGQHRLYGYSDSDYATNNQIPVVAFENLDKTKQLQLFMEINENQKAVPKALRNILEIDINRDSKDMIKQRKALMGLIGKRLGEDSNSPLYGRVIIGEDAQTSKCCITLENIKLALEKTHFFNRYKKNNAIEKKGIFDYPNADSTMAAFYPFFLKCLQNVVNECKEEWYQVDSFIAKNNGIAGIIRIIDDIVCILVEKDNDLKKDLNKLYEESQYFLLLLATTINEMPPEKKEKIRSARGASAIDTSYHTIQVIMHEKDASFTNKDIDDYYVEHVTNYNDEAMPQIQRIKRFFVEYIKKEIATDESWMNRFLSEEHENDLMNRVSVQNNSNKRKGINSNVEVWDLFSLNDVVEMIKNGSNWSTLFKPLFAKISIDINKIEAISKLKSIHEQEMRVINKTHITLSDYNVIKNIYEKINDGTEE